MVIIQQRTISTLAYVNKQMSILYHKYYSCRHVTILSTCWMCEHFVQDVINFLIHSQLIGPAHILSYSLFCTYIRTYVAHKGHSR